MLRVHSLANQVVQQVNVEENTIEQSAYLLWDQTAGAAGVTFARNEIAADVDRVHGYNKDNGQLVNSSPDMAGDALNITVTWFDGVQGPRTQGVQGLSLIHISEPTRQAEISYAVFCLKKKKKKRTEQECKLGKRTRE